MYKYIAARVQALLTMNLTPLCSLAGVSFSWGARRARLGVPPCKMTTLIANTWEIVAGSVAIAAAGAAAIWMLVRKRPTAAELERARRQFLVQSGRLVDGMLLDVFEVPAEDGRTLTMLLFSYRVGGVDYECSQDITDMRGVVDAAQVRAGFPCTVRSQPGNPQNSIVVAEEWSGLRIGLPVLPIYDDPEPNDLSHLRPGRG
jgi:hypothetical protein